MVDLFVKDITEGIAGHGHQGRGDQVRHRSAGRDARRRAGAAGLRPGPPGHRRADHHAHRRRPASAASSSSGSSPTEGVDLTRVVIGHCGDTDDLDYLEELIANGRILGMDRFGIDGYLPTAERVEVIAELCRRGYADRMVLSHDASCYLDWIPGEIPPSDDAALALPAHQPRRAAGAAGQRASPMRRSTRC